MAEKLEITKLPQTVYLLGVELKVVGVFDPISYNQIRDLENSYISPIDPRFPNMAQPIPTHELILMPYNLARYLSSPRFSGTSSGMPNYKIVSITIQPYNEEETQELLLEIFNRYTIRVFGGLAKQNVISFNRAGTISPTAQGGFLTQAIPMILVALTLLNVMLGSVYERTKDIFIYSSVGLSPRQVSMLFVVEAATVAVVGSLIGYVIGISIGYIYSSLFPSADFFVLNPTSSVTASMILITIGVTLAANVYPMIKAGRVVTPSLERTWRMSTKPIGDDWSIPLPFVVKAEEADGVLCYMSEFFSLHKGKDALDFMVINLSYEEVTEGKKEIRKVGFDGMIEPYSEGIKQRMELYISTSIDKKELSIGILIKRLLGSKRMWMEKNHKVVSLVREQLLLWRSLPAEERNKYIERSRTTLKAIS
jgi:hypothetical protein